MKNLGWAPLLLALVALPASAETAEDLDTWFRDGYAALYVEDSWDHADEFAQYIAEEITTRTEEGVFKSDVNGFVVESLDEWRSEGWLGTDVEELDTTLLNASTAVFEIKWLDRNADGSTANECGWYLADKVDGKWLLSQYITMSCAD
jgi:hypothetical protein